MSQRGNISVNSLYRSIPVLQLSCSLCYFSVRFHLVLIMMSSSTLRTSSETIPSLYSSSSSGIISACTTSVSSSSQQFLVDAGVQKVAQAVARIIAPSAQDPRWEWGHPVPTKVSAASTPLFCVGRECLLSRITLGPPCLLAEE